MVAEFSIIVSAFTLQLLALPGEKGQLIISALATKYKAIPVAVGASSAFAIWTVVEIWFGSRLEGALPESYLNWLVASLLIVFAALILYDTTTETTATKRFEDNTYFQKVSGYVPDRIEGGIMAFLVMCFGEFGDKTQIITIGLAAKYGVSPEIWIGEMLAIIPVTFFNSVAVSKLSDNYGGNKIKYLASIILVLFALDIIAGQLVGTSITPI